MKILFSLVIFFTLVSCANNQVVYWCGDHACINKKEKEAYFKKTLIVEVKEKNEKNNKSDSEITKITKQVQLEEKKRIKKEKDLAKQVKLEEKRRIKEEKDLAKQVKLEEKRRIKEKRKKDNQTFSKEEKIVKKIIKTTNENVKEYSNTESNKISDSRFNELVERIIKKNSFKPYPDINDIPN